MDRTRNRLRAIRAGLGFTQAEMAARLACSLRAYSDNENGIPRRLYVLAAETVAIFEAYTRRSEDVLPEDLLPDCRRLIEIGYLDARMGPRMTTRPAAPDIGTSRCKGPFAGATDGVPDLAGTECPAPSDRERA